MKPRSTLARLSHQPSTTSSDTGTGKALSGSANLQSVNPAASAKPHQSLTNTQSSSSRDEVGELTGLGHIPMLWLVLPQILGYTLAPTLSHSWQPFFLVGCSLLLLLVARACLHNNVVLLSWKSLYLAGAVLLAAGYYNWRQPPEPQFDTLAVREAEVVVRIERAIPNTAKRNYVSVYGKVITTPPHIDHLRGQKLFITISRNVDAIAPTMFTRGAQCRIRGVLKLNTQQQDNEANSFSQFLHRNGYYYRLTRARVVETVQAASTFQRWCYRQNLGLRAIAQLGAHSEREIELANVYTAMMLGIKGVLSPEQKEIFRISGTMHLFAISGLHVGIIAATLYMLLQILRVPPLPRCIIALLVLLLYVHITGATPSAVRAFFMAFFYWAATGFRRKRSTLSALLASAFAVLIYDPQQLLSIGFQLSYTVVGGILLYGRPLIEAMQERWTLFRFTPEDALHPWQQVCQQAWRWSLGLMGISIAAFMFSTPLSMAYFQVFSPGAIMLNMVLVPLASLAIIGGSVSFALGLLQASAGSVLFNHGSWLLIYLMTQCLEVVVTLPWIFGTIDRLSLTLAVVCECLMFAYLLVLYYCKQHNRAAFYLGPPILLLGMGLFNGILL